MTITIETYKDEPKYYKKISVEVADGSKIGEALESMIAILSIMYSVEGAKDAVVELAESYK